MARAIVPRWDVEPDGDELVFTGRVAFGGSDIAADASVVTVRVVDGDNLAAIRDKMVTAVVAEATRLGYSVARTAVLVPQYARGV